MVNCVYIHIPFCEKKCNYCSFCSHSLLKYQDEYVNSLIKEIKFLYKNESLKTIYFGGGTPSLLSVQNIEKILSCLKFTSNTQITIEINPNTVSKEKLIAYKNVGINRLSIGVQTFDDNILKEIGRLHTSKNSINVIENAKNLGFNNISIDLMYGLPNQNLSLWKKTLDIALKLDIRHVSLYGLKIEEGTYFYKFPPKNIANSDEQALMYEIAIKKLSEKFVHYEVSNFAKSEEYYSIHNLAYWNCENYYGIGVSASGYLLDKRYTNTFNFNDYLKNPIEKKYEILSLENRIEEEVFLGLRQTKGISFDKINSKFNINIYQKYKKQFDKFTSLGLMENTDNGVKLTLRGIEIQNEILCEFIDV